MTLKKKRNERRREKALYGSYFNVHSSSPLHSMDVKALTFDTGGTILDWHTGFKQAIERVVTAHDGGDDKDGSVEKDWGDPRVLGFLS